MNNLEQRMQQSRVTTQRAQQQQKIRDAIQRQASSRLEGVQYMVDIATGKRVATARDSDAARRSLAALEQIKESDRLQEERQLAVDSFLSDAQELRFMPTDLLQKPDLEADSARREAAIDDALQDLQVQAIAREGAYQQLQIQRLVNLSRLQKDKLLQQRNQEIAAAYDTYVTNRQLNMLSAVREVLVASLQATQQTSASMEFERIPLLQEQPMLEAQLAELVRGVNSTTAFIQANAMKLLYNIQAYLKAESSIYTAAVDISQKIFGIQRELTFLSDRIRQGDSQVPVLLAQRDSLLGQLQGLNSEIGALRTRVMNQQDPQTVAAALSERLTTFRSQIQQQLGQFDTGIATKSTQLTQANIELASAIQARQDAIRNGAAALDQARASAQTDVINYEDDYALSLLNLSGLRTTRDSHRTTRDGFFAQATQFDSAWRSTDRTWYQPRLESYNAFVMNIFTPSETAFFTARSALTAATGQITTLDGVATSYRNVLSMIAPIVQGGFPVKSAALVRMETRMSQILTLVETTYPGLLQSLATTATLQFQAAAAINLLIAAPSGVYYVAQTISKPPSDAAMTAFLDVDKRLTDSIAETQRRIQDRDNAAANKATFMNQSQKQIASYLRTLYTLQAAVYKTAKETAATTATSAASLAGGYRVLSPTQNPILAQTSLVQKTATRDSLNTQIVAMDTKIGTQMRQYAVNDATLNVITAMWVLNTLNSSYLGPQMKVVKGLVDSIASGRADVSNLGGKLPGLLGTRTTTKKSLDDATTSKDQLDASKRGLEQGIPLKRLSIQLYNDLLKTRNDRGSLFSLMKAKKEEFERMIATYEGLKSSFARDATFPTTVRARVNIQTLTSTASDLTLKQGDLDTANSQFQTLVDVSLPGESARWGQASQEMYLLRGATDPIFAAVALYSGRVSIADGQLTTADTTITLQSGVVSGLVGVASQSLNLPLSALFETRRTTKATLDVATGLRDAAQTDLDRVESRGEQLFFLKNFALPGLKALFEGRARVRGLVATQRQTYQGLFNTYKSAKEAANRGRVFFLQGSDYAPTAEFFQIGTDLAQKIDLLAQIQIPTETDPTLIGFQKQLADATFMRQGTVSNAALRGTQQTLDTSLVSMNTASQTLNVFKETVLDPQTALVAGLNQTLGSLPAIETQLGLLGQERTTAKQTLDGVVSARALVFYFLGLAQTATDLRSTRSDRIASREMYAGFFRSYSATFSSSSMARLAAKGLVFPVRPAISGLLTDSGTLSQKTTDAQGVSTELQATEGSIQTARASLVVATTEKSMLDAGTNPVKLEMASVAGTIQTTEFLASDTATAIQTESGVVAGLSQTAAQQLPSLTGLSVQRESARAALDGAVSARDAANTALGQTETRRTLFGTFTTDILAAFSGARTRSREYLSSQRSIFSGMFAQLGASKDSAKALTGTVVRPALPTAIDTATLVDRTSQSDTLQQTIDSTAEQLTTATTAYLTSRTEKAMLDAGTDSTKIALASVQSSIEVVSIELATAEGAVQTQATTLSNLETAANQTLPDLTGVSATREAAQTTLNDAKDAQGALQGTVDTTQATVDLNTKTIQAGQDLAQVQTNRSALRGLMDGIRSGFSNAYAYMAGLSFFKPAAQRSLEATDTVLSNFSTILGKLAEQDVLTSMGTTELDMMINFFQEMYTKSTLEKMNALVQDYAQQFTTASTDLATQQTTVNQAGTNIAAMSANLAVLQAALQRALDAKVAAQTTLDTATTNRSNTSTNLNTLLGVRSDMYVLIENLQSFNSVIESRWSERTRLMGLRESFKIEMERQETAKDVAAEAKTDATIDLANMRQMLRETVADVRTRATALENANNLYDGVSESILAVMNLVEANKSKLGDLALQRELDPIGKLRNLLVSIELTQSELNEILDAILRVENRISQILNQMNDPTLGLALRQSLELELNLLLKLRNDYAARLQDLRDLIARIQQRIMELLEEILALNKLRDNLRGRLPIVGFGIFGIFGAAAAGGVIAGGLMGFFGPRTGGREPGASDCVAAKQRGYRDGYAAGSKDGFQRGYADAKADFEKNQRRALLSGIQESEQPPEEEAPPPPPPQPLFSELPPEEEQVGGQQPYPEDAGLDQEQEQPPEEEEEPSQLMALPTGYTSYPPDVAPVPSDDQIKVPILSNVSPQYQQCYRQGYLAGYKLAFESGYFKGWRAFKPSQFGFMPPVQEQPEKEEEAQPAPPQLLPPEEAAPAEEDLGYAAAPLSAPPGFGDEAGMSQQPSIPSDFAPSEAYREEYARRQASQFFP